MRLAILDAFFLFGCIKSGYIADLEMNPNFKRALKDESGAIVIDPNTGEISIDSREDIVTGEKFVARRTSPASLIFDIEAGSCFDDGRFIIQVLNKPLEEVKKDKKCSNTADLEANYSVKLGLGLSPDALAKDEYLGLEDDLRRVVLYEIYDIENDKLKVLAKGHKKYLRFDDMPNGVDKHPYSFLVFNDVPDEIYGVSDLRSLKSPQEEVNKGRAMIMAHAKRFGRKFGYIESLIDEDAIENLKSGEDGVLFKVKELPLEKVIEPLKDAPLDAAVYANFSQALVDFREVGGATEQDRGVVERRKTAFEASKMTEASSVRKQDRKSLVEDFACEVGNKLLQSMQANLTLQDAVKIGNKGYEQDWVQVDREAIKGNFNVTVELGSMVPKLPEFERQDFVMALQVIAQFPPKMVEMYVNFAEMLKAIPSMFPALENFTIINDDETIAAKQREYQLEVLRQTLLQTRGNAGTAGPDGAPVADRGPDVQKLIQQIMGGTGGE
jgi:hypothetical protein